VVENRRNLTLLLLACFAAGEAASAVGVVSGLQLATLFFLFSQLLWVPPLTIALSPQARLFVEDRSGEMKWTAIYAFCVGLLVAFFGIVSPLMLPLFTGGRMLVWLGAGAIVAGIMVLMTLGAVKLRNAVVDGMAMWRNTSEGG
jgi:hypothetical protein